MLCALNELKKMDCEVILMHVIEFDVEMIDSFAGVTFDRAKDELIKRAKEKLENLLSLFHSAGIKARYIEPYIGDPVVEIVRKAEEEKVGLIMMGARGKGLSRKLKVVLGSVSDEVLELSSVPVLITKFEVKGGVCQTVEGLFRNVLYAFDFTSESRMLLDYIKRFPIENVIALHVAEEEVDLDFIEKIKVEYPSAKIILKLGKVGKVIVDIAKEFNATLIAVGSKEKLGSVSNYVVRNSDVSVLVYK